MAQIRLSEETWRRLNARKDPGDSFDDIVQELLSEADRDEPVEA